MGGKVRASTHWRDGLGRRRRARAGKGGNSAALPTCPDLRRNKVRPLAWIDPLRTREHRADQDSQSLDNTSTTRRCEVVIRGMRELEGVRESERKYELTRRYLIFGNRIVLENRYSTPSYLLAGCPSPARTAIPRRTTGRSSIPVDRIHTIPPNSPPAFHLPQKQSKRIGPDEACLLRARRALRRGGRDRGEPHVRRASAGPRGTGHVKGGTDRARGKNRDRRQAPEERQV